MTTGSAHSACRDRSRREASEWFVILEPNREMSPLLQKKWVRWAADPKNLAQFREYQRLDELLRSLPRRPLPTQAELRDHFSSATSSMSDRGTLSHWLANLSDTLSTPRARHASVAAFLLAVFSIGLFQMGYLISSGSHIPGEQVYQTHRGEQRTVALQDGSIVKLGGETRLGVLIESQIRHITLYGGEAMFKVAHNPRIPFQVDVANTRVTDAGTEFHIRYYPDQQVIVGVTDGAVSVTPRAKDTGTAGRSLPEGTLQSVTVTAGEAASSDATGQITAAHPADFKAMAWWLYGRRVYREKPLGKVIQDLQLYSPRQIDYDQRIATFPFTGIVDQSKPDEWVRGLREILPVEIDESNPQRLFIRCRQVDCR